MSKKPVLAILEGEKLKIFQPVSPNLWGLLSYNTILEWPPQYQKRGYGTVLLYVNVPGVRFPANSVGILPHHILDVEEREKAFGMLHNVQQINQQYDAHENKIKKSTFFFVPYKESKINRGENFFYYRALLSIDKIN